MNDWDLLDSLLMGMLSCNYNLHLNQSPDVRLKTVLESIPELQELRHQVLEKIGQTTKLQKKLAAIEASREFHDGLDEVGPGASPLDEICSRPLTDEPTS